MPLQINDELLNDLLRQAGANPRLRSNKNFHQSLDEPVQRLCIGLKKGTYIRPHHHPRNNKWELMLVLRGAIAYVLFDAEGKVRERFDLEANGSLCGLETPPNTWHTVFPLTDEAVFFEVKEGPYAPSEAGDFASWAPAEDDAQVPHFLSWLDTAKPDDQYNLPDMAD